MTDLGAPILNIEGDLVALGPLQREHIEFGALEGAHHDRGPFTAVAHEG